MSKGGNVTNGGVMSPIPERVVQYPRDLELQGSIEDMISGLVIIIVYCCKKRDRVRGQ